MSGIFFIEIRAGNFRGTRSLLMRSLLRGAGSKQRRQESGRRILKNHGLVGNGVAEERVSWRCRECWSTAYYIYDGHDIKFTDGAAHGS